LYRCYCLYKLTGRYDRLRWAGICGIIYIRLQLLKCQKHCFFTLRFR
jgi:hypothetical protein